MLATRIVVFLAGLALIWLGCRAFQRDFGALRFFRASWRLVALSVIAGGIALVAVGGRTGGVAFPLAALAAVGWLITWMFFYAQAGLADARTRRSEQR